MARSDVIVKVDLFLVSKVDAEKKSKKQVKKERIKAAEEARRGRRTVTEFASLS